MENNYTEVTPNGEEELDVVELKDDSGKILKFYHIGTIEYKERWFAFFQPAEKMDGVSEDEVVIFEISGEEGNEALLPIEDETLLDEVYAEFIKEMEDDECDCEGDCEDDDCDCGCGSHKEHSDSCGCGCGKKHD